MKKGSINPHLYRAKIKNCIICGKKYRAIQDTKKRKQKFCSRECFKIYWIKKIEPNIKRIKVFGKKNSAWKGKNVGYYGIHHWVNNNKGTPKKCEICGIESAKKYEWANKDHKYKRNLNDYLRMCTRCHRKYDLNKYIKRILPKMFIG